MSEGVKQHIEADGAWQALRSADAQDFPATGAPDRNTSGDGKWSARLAWRNPFSAHDFPFVGSVQPELTWPSAPARLPVPGGAVDAHKLGKERSGAGTSSFAWIWSFLCMTGG